MTGLTPSILLPKIDAILSLQKISNLTNIEKYLKSYNFIPPTTTKTTTTAAASSLSSSSTLITMPSNAAAKNTKRLRKGIHAPRSIKRKTLGLTTASLHSGISNFFQSHVPLQPNEATLILHQLSINAETFQEEQDHYEEETKQGI